MSNKGDNKAQGPSPFRGTLSRYPAAWAAFAVGYALLDAHGIATAIAAGVTALILGIYVELVRVNNEPIEVTLRVEQVAPPTTTPDNINMPNPAQNKGN